MGDEKKEKPKARWWTSEDWEKREILIKRYKKYDKEAIKESPKYFLSGETIRCGEHNLQRIIAMKDIPESGVKKGDYGGYVESYENLSQIGNCWVYKNAKVCADAYVCEDARVFDNAMICDWALVRGWSKVFDNAFVGGTSCISDHGVVAGNAFIRNLLYLRNHSKVTGDVTITGVVWTYDHSVISGERRPIKIIGHNTLTGYVEITTDLQCGEWHKDSRTTYGDINTEYGGR